MMESKRKRISDLCSREAEKNYHHAGGFSRWGCAKFYHSKKNADLEGA